MRPTLATCRLLDTNFLTGDLPDSWSANASSWPSLSTMCVLECQRNLLGTEHETRPKLKYLETSSIQLRTLRHSRCCPCLSRCAG